MNPVESTLTLVKSKAQLVELLRSNSLRLFVNPGGRGDRSEIHPGGSRQDGSIPVFASRPLLENERTLGPCPDGLIRGEQVAWITPELREEVNRCLLSDAEELRRLSSWPIVRTFVYLDISDFSTLPPGHQALIVTSLPTFVSEAQRGRRPEHTGTPEQMICTGDGYIFVFVEPVAAAWFAAQLATEIDYAVAKPKDLVEIHYRMGVHIGEVFPFEERADRWNFTGDGINGGRRVLDAIGKNADDLVFLSGDVVKAIHAKAEISTGFGEIMQYLVNRGRRKDKHDKPWRVYELNHRDAASNSKEIRPS